MSSSDLPTLVMGARAGIGRLVLDRLLAAGVPVRASSRRPDPDGFPNGVESVVADLHDRVGLEAALDGVRQAFVFADAEGVGTLIDAARAAGVHRIVLLSSGSVIHPTSVGNPIAEEHRSVEEALARARDLEVIPIRPLVLATNALGWAHSIRATSTLALYRPDAATAPLDERDLADVIVLALRGRDDVSTLLTGPEPLSQRAQVDAIADATGRPIAVRELDRTAAHASLARFMPEQEADAILMFLDDAAAGNSTATDAVAQLLGRPAGDYASWARRHADDFAPEG